jgi:hypothetical protein
MTSKLNNKSSRGGSTGGQPSGKAGNHYSPSVPISLYRQLSAELQATQAMLDSLKGQNQQLIKQNQQLRLEIEKVVQSTLQLRQVADSFQPMDLNAAVEAVRTEAESAIDPYVSSGNASPIPPQGGKAEPEAAFLQELFTEQESQPRRVPKAEKSSNLGGLGLIVVIFLTVMVAFGLGFVGLNILLPRR